MTQQSESIGVDFFFGLGAQIGAIHDKVMGMGSDDGCTYQAGFVLQVPLSGGAGTLDESPQLAPVRGQCWSIRRLNSWGYTAGQVQFQINGMEPVWTFNAPANPPALPQCFGRGECLLQPGDRLVVVATGITGIVNIAVAPDAFPYWHLGRYLR